MSTRKLACTYAPTITLLWLSLLEKICVDENCRNPFKTLNRRASFSHQLNITYFLSLGVLFDKEKCRPKSLLALTLLVVVVAAAAVAAATP
uniref:Uncharacterized protein n=1 Tax=Helianthus annuus TaxID=4232 RepID=A0A251S1D8_HELAN